MFCRKCGADIGDANFCPKCGAPASEEQQPPQQQPAPQPQYQRPFAQINNAQSVQQPKKKKSGCLIAGGTAVLIVLFIFLVLVCATFGISFFQSAISEYVIVKENLIIDADQIAGKDLNGVEAIVGELVEDGSVDLITANGETIKGTVYSIPDSLTHFDFVEDKLVRYQYWSDEPVPYTKEKDIFKMFGILPANTLKEEVNTGYAIRYSSVSDTVSEFWIQSMDQKEKTFTTVMITYDSSIAGQFANEPKKSAAEKFDTEVWAKVVKVMKMNNTMKDGLNAYANGNIAAVDLYDACNSISKQLVMYSFPESSNENEEVYVESCKTFTLYVQTAAKAMAKYLNSQTTENLSKLKENIEQSTQASMVVAGNRGTFLSVSGFSEEEIQEKIDKIEDELGK